MKLKLQIESPLTGIVRKPRTHRIPKEIYLQLPIYVFAFVVMQLVECAFMLPMIYDSFMDWQAQKLLHESNGELYTFRRVVDELTDIMMFPENFKIMLFCTGAGTLAIFLWCRLIEGRKLRTLGFIKQGAVKQYLLGLLAGAVTFSAVVGIGALTGGLHFEGYRGQFTVSLLLIFIGFLIQGMSEEVLCRGYILTSTLRHHNMWWAAGINSVLFSAMHFANKGYSVFAFINLTLIALVFSLYVLRTGNLWGTCAFHSIWNFSQGNFYGLPVSGLNSGDSIFAMSLNGSSIFNGGDFGLEASIGTTIVSVIWIFVLLFVPNPFAKKSQEQEKTT